MPERVYACESKYIDSLKKLMEYDPYLDKNLTEEQLSKIKTDPEANVIFARQDYKIKDGISVGLDGKFYYLYISANDEFIEKADKKLKSTIPGIKRVDPETETKIISTINKEREESEEGIGLIFR
ncbi:MAG: hypothetical protein M1122_00250 [Candidatus Marsarchaeota archaeon]|nr:hypothetical protein [Candidatus Marsarchaeota archaeon]